MKLKIFLKDTLVYGMLTFVIVMLGVFVYYQPLVLVPLLIAGAILAYNDSEVINIKYFDTFMDPILKIKVGDWIDLRAAETVELKAGEYYPIPLGVGMILPDEYEAHILPRSSLFKNHGVMLANSMGVIDNSYSGDGDEWHFLAYATRDTKIIKNERICQFRIVRNQPRILFKFVKNLKKISRGGIGSTGKE